MAVDRNWDSFVQTCREIGAFLRLHSETEWSRTFSCLEHRAHEARDPESRREVLIQARAIFGGMGSFNDLVIDNFGEIPKSDNRQLDELRDELYDSLARNMQGRKRWLLPSWFRRVKKMQQEPAAERGSLIEMIEEISEILAEHGRPDSSGTFRKKAEALRSASTPSEIRVIYEGLLQSFAGGSGSLADLVLHRNGKPLKKGSSHFDYLMRCILDAAYQGLADLDADSP